MYHEHFSYLSLQTVSQIFQSVGLRIWDVEQLSTHGGSLRIYGCHDEDKRATTVAVNELLAQEIQSSLQQVTTYTQFQQNADRVKNELLQFLIEQKGAGKTVAAYGAAAKGNTLLNYGGVKPDLLPFVCDAAQAKQGKYMPGSHIPILAPEAIQQAKPDFILILPWNIAPEVQKQLTYIREWGGKFVVAVPSLTIV
ncbi:hypothetical protein D5085_06110 [Ectothiorhodospiraceae bacterium BW-2]|nr:hypothetical protein D5085_06110 [Ectothiorhodospiraceae bacterium BW-2]